MIAHQVTVEFKIDVRHISMNRTLDALATINNTDIVLNIREEVESKGLKLPDMEIASLFVDRRWTLYWHVFKGLLHSLE